MKIFVTGMGVVSALGKTTSGNLSALQSATSGIKIGSSNRKKCYLGSAPIEDAEIRAKFNINKDDVIPRTSLLGLWAADQAIANVDLNDRREIAFINGTTTGGMDLSERYFQEALKTNQHDLLHTLKSHDLGATTSFIQGTLGLEVYANTISTACSSAANAIMLGARMIQAGQIERVLVGGTDALTNFTIDGFSSLMIYDDNECRPFDHQRTGLNLGEGAGYLLLEGEAIAPQENRLAEVTGWANANDAYHQTGTSPNGLGAQLAMEASLAKANLSAADIGYLNAHGTATKNNDDSEMAAIDHVFNDIDFSSTKSYTGHTLGAAGGIEAVFSILSLLNQQAFPNLRWSNPMESTNKKPLTTVLNKKIGHVMSNSFGFGGNSTSLIFSKV